MQNLNNSRGKLSLRSSYLEPRSNADIESAINMCLCSLTSEIHAPGLAGICRIGGEVGIFHDYKESNSFPDGSREKLPGDVGGGARDGEGAKGAGPLCSPCFPVCCALSCLVLEAPAARRGGTDAGHLKMLVTARWLLHASCISV